MNITPTSNLSVIRPQPQPQANMRLLCFPCAGGSSQHFRTWSNILPTTIEVCLIELPGRGIQMRSALFYDLKALVSALAIAIKPYLDKSFSFFGHSMGGLISFELTRLLRTQGDVTPNHLFVAASRPPQFPRQKPHLHTLSDAAFIEELRLLNGTPDEILANRELMKLLLPMLRADFTALETYVYTHQPPLDIPICVFGGSQDKEVPPEQLPAWQEHTTGAFSLNMFPGDHFFTQSAQPSLLQMLCDRIFA